jgi:hypothetical protein
MKTVALRLIKTATCSLIAGLFFFMTSGVAFAQTSVTDVLKDTARQGALEALGVKKPVQGQTEMMDGAKMMMKAKKTIKNDLIKDGKLKEGAVLDGEMMMSEGYETMVEGDKLLQAQKTPDGKKKMLDGARTMVDARKRMMDELTRKRLVKEGKATEGESMMKDGEKMVKNGEKMMLQ